MLRSGRTLTYTNKNISFKVKGCRSSKNRIGEGKQWKEKLQGKK